MKISTGQRGRVRAALLKLAEEVQLPGRRGKKTKTIQGSADKFHRLRVGDYRIMFDVLEKEKIILVLGIVNRSELEKWLRDR